MSTPVNSLPIGFFDSGVGGISVLREAVKLLPGEDFLYFGDSANAPYGTRTEAQIRHLVLESARQLYDEGIKALVIACNTATSVAITDLRRIYTRIPVIGIEPALKPAVHTKPHPVVLVMATPGTVAGNKFHHLMEQEGKQARVIPVACPGLMEYVEQGILEGQKLENYLRRTLGDHLAQADAIVLGCTHYPFIKKTLRKIAGEEIAILDGSYGTAVQLKRRLTQAQLCSLQKSIGQVTFQMSLPGMEPLCRRLLECSLE